MGSSFSMDGGGTSPEDTCVICTESGADQDTGVEQVQICPNGHYAHVDCITPWYARRDTCPECRDDVQNFPLWLEINPIEPEPAPAPAPVRPYDRLFPNAVTSLPRLNYFRPDFDNNEGFEPVYDFSDPEQEQNAVRRFMDMKEQNDYQIALEYFDSDEGYAYLEYLLKKDADEAYELSIVSGEDQQDVNIDSLMYNIIQDGQMNVAEALYTYTQSHGFVDDIFESSGAIINKFVNNFDTNQNIINWLWSRGFTVSFGFLDDAVFDNINANAVQWYLTNVKPSIDDEELIDIFNDLEEYITDEQDDIIRDELTDEQNDIYNLLDTYINNNTQVHQGGQYGGMWQSGGFFMTCS